MEATLTTTSAGLDGVDLTSPDWYAEGHPHAVWRLLRERAPVWRQTAADGTPFWSVTRYDDVVAVLRDTTTYSSAHSTMLSALHGDIARGKAIHLIDPPRHGAVRGPLVGALSTRVLREREPAIRERVGRLVRAGLKADGVDVARLMSLLPMAVAGDLLGVPPDAWGGAARWTVASMAPDDPAYRTGSPAETLRHAHVWLLNMFGDLIAQRRRRPAGDLVSLLATVRPEGRLLDDEEILVNCYAFLIGSNITTPQVAGHLVLVMAAEPQLWQRLRADPALVAPAVEECLRWATPTNHLLRRASVPVTLGGHDIPAGGLVCAWVASANRDERVFTEPFRFDPARRPNPQVAFGIGPHRCIGDRVARTGLRLLVEQLAAHVDGVTVTGEVVHLRSNFLNGFTSLPAVLRPARRNEAAA